MCFTMPCTGDSLCSVQRVSLLALPTTVLRLPQEASHSVEHACGQDMSLTVTAGGWVAVCSSRMSTTGWLLLLQVASTCSFIARLRPVQVWHSNGCVLICGVNVGCC
jgi:hypothetical protein